MFKYFSSYFISSQILNKVSDIMEKLGKLNDFDDLSKMPDLKKDNISKLVYSSLTIEKDILSFDDVKNIISNNATTNDEKQINKIRNIYELYQKEELLNPYLIEEIKDVSKILLDSTGNFRRINEMRTMGKRCIILAPPPDMIEPLLIELIDFVKTNEGVIHPLILSAIFHYKFIYISPFTDENAIMARMWQNVILSKWKKIFKYVPVEEKILKYKVEYKEAIDKCNQSGSFNDFIEFMLKVIDESLEDLLNNVSNQINPVTISVSKLLSIMEPNVPISANEIMERLNIKSKETLRGTYLKPAMQAGLVASLLPNKPTSKKQMYYKVK